MTLGHRVVIVVLAGLLPAVFCATANGAVVGREYDVHYDYPYKGVIVKGTTTFVFTVRVVELNGPGTEARVSLVAIKRYWNGEIREKNITAMPFKDPRGYAEYVGPREWSRTVRIGDRTSIETRNLLEVGTKVRVPRR